MELLEGASAGEGDKGAVVVVVVVVRAHVRGDDVWGVERVRAGLEECCGHGGEGIDGDKDVEDARVAAAAAAAATAGGGGVGDPRRGARVRAAKKEGEEECEESEAGDCG